ncbi:MAG: tetrahydrofolate dehydrogenase/cyclohydrolase catalytic domain-containing protein, partial [Candidatus Aenigmatarchaeota archaeon]
FNENVEEERLIQYIEELNEDSEIHGVLIQLPLPEDIDNNRVFEALRPEKDVDGLTPENMGKTLRGNASVKPGAVEAVEKILEKHVEFQGLEVAIVNNSNLIGKPLSMSLTQKGATVTLCNVHTENLEAFTQGADVVVTATGTRGVLDAESIPEDSIVVDAGYSHGEGDIEDVEAVS